jgi:hypothetical protein
MHLLNFGIKFSSAICLLGHLDFLKEGLRGSQILIVTLKGCTVAKATQIFGIYSKSGASEIVHYKNPDKIALAQIKASDPNFTLFKQLSEFAQDIVN